MMTLKLIQLGRNASSLEQMAITGICLVGKWEIDIHNVLKQ